MEEKKKVKDLLPPEVIARLDDKLVDMFHKYHNSAYGGGINLAKTEFSKWLDSEVEEGSAEHG